MSDPAPDQEPEPQPKWSGGPPKPPKKTAGGLEEGSPGDDYPLSDLVDATIQSNRLIELLESIRGSRLVALNILERELDACVVSLAKLAGKLKPVDHKVALRQLRTIRDYRHLHPQPSIPTYSGDPELRKQAQKVLDEIN